MSKVWNKDSGTCGIVSSCVLITDYIRRISGVFVFDERDFALAYSPTSVFDDAQLTQWRTDVEGFLNTRGELAVCHRCGVIDDKMCLENTVRVHLESDACIQGFVIEWAWIHAYRWVRFAPRLFRDSVRKLVVKALAEIPLCCRQRPDIVAEFNNDFASTWVLPVSRQLKYQRHAQWEVEVVRVFESIVYNS